MIRVVTRNYKLEENVGAKTEAGNQTIAIANKGFIDSVLFSCQSRKIVILCVSLRG